MDYNGLIVGPGGNKGFAYLGQLSYLEKEGLLKNIKKYVGVSVGSIITLLMVCGYSILEILDQGHRTDLLDMENVLSIQDMLMKKAIFSQRTFEEKLDKLVIEKFGKVLSLKDIYEITGKEYVTVTTDLTSTVPKPVFLSHKTFPDMSCVQATLMSSNMPLVFTTYNHLGREYSDGGLTNPYPIDYFDESDRIIGLNVLGETSNSFLQIVQSPMVQLRLRIMEAYNHKRKCTHFQTIVKMNKSGGFLLSKKDKIDLFEAGLIQTKATLYPIRDIEYD